MTELTGVISSTALEDTKAAAAVREGCPRQLLGLTCIKSQYPCLCEQVDVTATELKRNENGQASELNLTLSLSPSTLEPRAVMASIELTGYKARFGNVSTQGVRASFDLRVPQNTPLRLFIDSTGF